MVAVTDTTLGHDYWVGYFLVVAFIRRGYIFDKAGVEMVDWKHVVRFPRR